MKSGGGRAQCARLCLSSDNPHGSAMTDMTPQHRPPFALDCIYYAASIGFFLYMFYYYWTGDGGPTLLAMAMIPVTFVLFTLQCAAQQRPLSALPQAANYVDRRRLLRLLALLRLLHEHQLHGARRRARRHVEHRWT